MRYANFGQVLSVIYEINRLLALTFTFSDVTCGVVRHSGLEHRHNHRDFNAHRGSRRNSNYLNTTHQVWSSSGFMLSDDYQSRNFRSLIEEGRPTLFYERPVWPVKKEAILEGDVILGGLMMVHEREDSITCGPIMPQGGIQALETMLYTLDVINSNPETPFSLGAHILDDCDKDTYGLEMAVDFIKGKLFCLVRLM